ncbi:MAG TPA: zinc metalloprotease HtpX [Methylomirabilota bacterium]|jgi:heat shock protein HtpX|nr:zinc metalloprotease HtpX [Methylomirabilota bacterium]
MVNTLKTTVLLALLTALFVAIGGFVGGRSGMLVAFVMALVMNFVSYWFSDKIVLAMYRAQPIGEAEAPIVYRIVRNLATTAGIPMPRLYLIPSATPNAFATGRSPRHAAVAVTEGILRIMDERELAGVLAHELSHVLNRDVLISTVAATLGGAISMLAHMAQWGAMFGGSRDDDERGMNPIALLVTIIVAPLAAMLIQMAVSRAREYQADASGARLTRQPLGLASALAKLQQANEMAPMDANPATAHLFIVNPLSGQTLAKLFSTHPPIEERIARLRAMRV